LTFFKINVIIHHNQKGDLNMIDVMDAERVGRMSFSFICPKCKDVQDVSIDNYVIWAYGGVCFVSVECPYCNQKINVNLSE
jgi:phage FluMu protein Com